MGFHERSQALHVCLGVFGRLTQIHDDTGCSLINVAHNLDLLISFLYIALIDA